MRNAEGIGMTCSKNKKHANKKTSENIPNEQTFFIFHFLRDINSFILLYHRNKKYQQAKLSTNVIE